MTAGTSLQGIEMSVVTTTTNVLKVVYLIVICMAAILSSQWAVITGRKCCQLIFIHLVINYQSLNYCITIASSLKALVTLIR